MKRLALGLGLLLAGLATLRADDSTIAGRYRLQVRAGERTGTATLTVDRDGSGFSVTRKVRYSDGATETLSGPGAVVDGWLQVRFGGGSGVVDRLRLGSEEEGDGIVGSYHFHGQGQVLGRLADAAASLGWGSSKETGRSLGMLAERIAAPGLDNFARIAPGVYRGAQPTDEGFRWLKAHGFKTVINLRSWHSERSKVEALGMKAVAMPMVAGIFGSEAPKESQVREFFRLVLDPANQPVYFHCAHGKDRTGTMGALYRMEVDGWTADEAIAEMDAFGYHRIYRDLRRFVQNYRPRGYAGR